MVNQILKIERNISKKESKRKVKENITDAKIS